MPRDVHARQIGSPYPDAWGRYLEKFDAPRGSADALPHGFYPAVQAVARRKVAEG